MLINELKQKFEILSLKKGNLVITKLSNKIYLGVKDNNYIVIFDYCNNNKSKVLLTKCLKIYLNIPIEINFEGTEKKIVATMIELVSKEKKFIETFQFFILNIINYYKNIENLSEEIIKLWELFENKPVNNEKRIIGFFGELLFLKYCYEKYSYKIDEFWHSNFMNKYDFEFLNDVKLEVKTTTNSKRVHNFAHEQIFITEKNQKLIASILLNKVDKGVSLYDFIIELKSIFNYDFNWIVNEFLFKNQIDEFNKGIQINLQTSINSIKFFDAYDLPQIEEVPDGLTNVKYDICLENIKDIKDIKYLFNL